MREVVLLEFARGVTSEEAVAEATRLGLERPIYEDALAFGAAYPAVQIERPVVFLHDPWFGFFGRRDVISLWCNAGRRELGLEGFDGPVDHGLALWLRPRPRAERCPRMTRARPPFPGTMRARCAISQTLDGLNARFGIPDLVRIRGAGRAASPASG